MSPDYSAVHLDAVNVEFGCPLHRRTGCGQDICSFCTASLGQLTSHSARVRISRYQTCLPKRSGQHWMRRQAAAHGVLIYRHDQRAHKGVVVADVLYCSIHPPQEHPVELLHMS